MLLKLFDDVPSDYESFRNDFKAGPLLVYCLLRQGFKLFTLQHSECMENENVMLHTGTLV